MWYGWITCFFSKHNELKHEKNLIIVFSKKNHINVSNAIPKKYGKYNYRTNWSNFAPSGKFKGICILSVGGINELLAVSIQQLNTEPNIINTGKNVIGYAIKSTPKPYILLDNV